MLPAALDQLSVLVMAELLFIFLGTVLFRGLITHAAMDDLVDSGQFQKPLYKYNNFNDVPSSMLLMFELVVVNNWCDNVDMYVRMGQSRMARLFFVAHYVVTVLLCYNIFIASFI